MGRKRSMASADERRLANRLAGPVARCRASRQDEPHALQGRSFRGGGRYQCVLIGSRLLCRSILFKSNSSGLRSNSTGPRSNSDGLGSNPVCIGSRCCGTAASPARQPRCAGVVRGDRLGVPYPLRLRTGRVSREAPARPRAEGRTVRSSSTRLTFLTASIHYGRRGYQ